MSFPLFIASGQQGVSELIGWFIVVPLASVFSLLSLWFALKRWRVAAIVASLLTFALVALLMSDTPLGIGWIPAGLAAMGFWGALFLERLPQSKEPALRASAILNVPPKKMSTLSRSLKIQLAGGTGGAASFFILFAGLIAGGVGHGSYLLWYVGLGTAALSGLLLVAGTAGAAWKKEQRGLIYGLLAVATFVVVGLYFFDLTDWLAAILFHH